MKGKDFFKKLIFFFKGPIQKFKGRAGNWIKTSRKAVCEQE